MARFLLIIILLVVGGFAYVAVRYGKESYKILPAADQPENALETELDTETDFQNWIEFSPPSGAFKVLVPTTPQHVSDKSNDPKTNSKRIDDVYIAEKKNGNVFMIHTITYQNPKEAVAAEDELLHNFMQDMVASNPSNKLVASLPAIYKGKKALDFVIENDTFIYDVRAFLHNKTVVVLSSISRKPIHSLKDFELFINSFELTPTEQKPLKS